MDVMQLSEQQQEIYDRLETVMASNSRIEAQLREPHDVHKPLANTRIEAQLREPHDVHQPLAVSSSPRSEAVSSGSPTSRENIRGERPGLAIMARLHEGRARARVARSF